MTAARTAHCDDHREHHGWCAGCQRASLDAEHQQLAQASCPHPRQSGRLHLEANGFSRWLVCDVCGATIRKLSREIEVMA